MMTRLENKLITLSACHEAMFWAETQKCSFKESWNKCERADWMLWLLGRLYADGNKIVLASCKIARRAIRKHVPKENYVPLKVIEVTEDYINGNSTYDDVKKHSFDISDCFTSTLEMNENYPYVNALTSAIYASAAIRYSNQAPLSAFFAANSNLYDDNYDKELIKSANIVREFFPKPPKF